MLRVIYELTISILTVYGGYTLLHDIVHIAENIAKKRMQRRKRKEQLEINAGQEKCSDKKT